MVRIGMLAAVAALVTVVTAWATPVVLVDDNFEYSSQAAFEAAWPNTGTAAAVLSTEQAKSGTHSVKATTAAMRSGKPFTPTTPSNAEPVVFSVSYYDSKGSAAAYRQYATLLDDAGSGNGQLISLGLNNNLSSSSYMARIVGYNAGAFFKLDGTGVPTRSTGWHTLQAVVSEVDIKISVDGVLSKTIDISNKTTFPNRSYDQVRVGSNYTSGAVAYFDDVYVAKTPEPATLAVLVLGGLMMSRRRRA